MDVCLCVSVSHPGSLTFLFFPSHPYCIRLNASVARLPTRTYADLLYKTFQLKIVAPPINLAPLSMCFSLVPIPVEKTKNGRCYVCSPEGGCESYPPAISIIPFTIECIFISVNCIYCRLWLSRLSFVNIRFRKLWKHSKFPVITNNIIENQIAIVLMRTRKCRYYLKVMCVSTMCCVHLKIYIFSHTCGIDHPDWNISPTIG